PTLACWREKSLWEKFLGVIAAPSVFLLTITLPVVETQKDEGSDRDDMSQSFSLPGPVTPINNGTSQQQRSVITLLEPDSPSSEGPLSFKNGVTGHELGRNKPTGVNGI